MLKYATRVKKEVAEQYIGWRKIEGASINYDDPLQSTMLLHIKKQIEQYFKLERFRNPEEDTMMSPLA